MYRLPDEKKFPKERADWISVLSKINANLNITHDTAVCSKHWPPDKPTFLYYGKERPVDPPSVFDPDKIPASIVPSPPAPSRRTFRSSCQERNQQPDQLPDFEQIDRYDFQQLKNVLSTGSKDFNVPFRALFYDNSIVLTSEMYFHGIPYFMIKISGDLTYAPTIWDQKFMLHL